MKLLKRILKKEAGQALPMALILLVLGGLLVVPTLAFMTTNLNATRQIDRKNLELYAADAGVEKILWNIQYNQGTGPNNFTLPTGTGEQTVVNGLQVNGRTIVATISKQGADYRITSTASADGHSTTVECYLEISGGLFAAAITVTNGDLYIEDSTIEGDIWVSGDFSSEDSTVTRTVTENQTGEFVLLDPEPYRTEALSGTILEGNQKISEDTTWDTPIYINGDLIVEDGVTLTLNGTVWVTGSIRVEGLEDNHTFITGTGNLIAELGNIWIEYLRLETTNMPLIWAVHGNIEKIETNQYIKAIIYAPEGDIRIETTDVIYGAVFGKTVTLMENCTIIYPEEQDFDGILGGGEVQILTYTIQ